ncbi:MAG TPA: PEGA domain-containing protein [Thermotogota bacterium]|nr:PEGA domain-containing protein [Thermotogota bacterium]HRW92487.1 PEGA domain-containing protein [Thermotogota bacterium]
MEVHGASVKRKILLVLAVLAGSLLFCVPIRLFTNPGKVSVYIDGALFGISDRQGVFSQMLFLTPGAHVFHAEKPGYNPYHRVIEIAEATSVTLELKASGILRIQSDPPNAQILVDETLPATGTFEAQLPVGKHYVEVSAPGYLPRFFYLEVSQYFTREMHVSLTRAGKTSVLSEPPGLFVSVDGEDRGVTPLTLFLSPGRHLFHFSKEWYAPQSQVVEIQAEGENTVFQVLESFAHLEISTFPTSCSLELNGSPVGIAPLSLKELPTGKHVLAISAPGYVAEVHELFLEPGENTVFQELALKTYPLTVESTPAAIFLLDSQEQGLTPMTVQVAHGKHEIHLVQGEKEWLTRRVINAPERISVDLNRDCTVLMDVIPPGEAFVLHASERYELPALINTIMGIQTFDIQRGGYPVRRRVYRLSPGVIYSFSINLDGEAALFLVTDPPGATVSWMGQEIGQTPLRDVRVRPGSGTLRFSWPGGELSEQQVFLDGQTYTLIRTLPKSTQVTIDSFPPGCKTWMDGNFAGETPVTMRLRAGTYHFSCQGPDGAMQNRTVTLSGEEYRDVTFVF